ncbi:MAG: PHP domain-containing protein [Desulfamplus sp.]|nr:PHP domain-containing protein [Desulfamplus sp.]
MKNEIYADLHNHTTASDGDFSPEELVSMAGNMGISALGVTDHDTLEGLGPAVMAGRKRGVEVVPGVEISVRFKEPFFTGTLHVLCYFEPDMLNHGAFISALGRTLAGGRGDDLIRARIGEINRIFGPEGFEPILAEPLEFEEVSSYSPAVTRRHFALALKEKHNIHNTDIVNRIMGNDSPAYLPSGVDLGIIKSFLGEFPVLAVLAHPAAGSFPGRGHYKEVLPPFEVVERMLPAFLNAGICGVEINYPGHIQCHRKILGGWKKRYGLIETGGSDCHDAKDRPLGIEGVSREIFNHFKACITRRSRHPQGG